MKKLIEMSKQFQIDTQRNLERIGTKNEKSLYNDTNDSFYLTSMKTNELIRDSSFGNMRIKRTNSLKEMIIVTETKSKYLTRSNSRKILKNISNMRHEIEGYADPKKDLNHLRINNDNYMYPSGKKNFFGKTSLLLTQPKGGASYLNKTNNYGYKKSIGSINTQRNNKISFLPSKNIASRIRREFLDVDFDKAYRNLKNLN